MLGPIMWVMQVPTVILVALAMEMLQPGTMEIGGVQLEGGGDRVARF